ncbi:MAG: AAA family ATPase [Ramlibacter sp.]|nr:AAA family ATPase [Ramlibacter sp.]
MLIVFAGLPGSGKTTLAREFARRRGAVYLRIDSLEQALRRASPDAADGAAGYAAAQAVAADNLPLGHCVVADAVNAAPEARQGWAAVAAGASVPCHWVEVVCGDRAEHRRRAEAREADIVGHALPRWDAIEAMAWTPLAGDVLRLDSAAASIEANLAILMQKWPPALAGRPLGAIK